MNTGLLLKMKSTNRCSLYAFPPKAGQTRANTRDASAAALFSPDLSSSVRLTL